jgi:hypothetical protein
MGFVDNDYGIPGEVRVGDAFLDELGVGGEAEERANVRCIVEADLISNFFSEFDCVAIFSQTRPRRHQQRYAPSISCATRSARDVAAIRRGCVQTILPFLFWRCSAYAMSCGILNHRVSGSLYKLRNLLGRLTGWTWRALVKYC